MVLNGLGDRIGAGENLFVPEARMGMAGDVQKLLDDLFGLNPAPPGQRDHPPDRLALGGGAAARLAHLRENFAGAVSVFVQRYIQVTATCYDPFGASVCDGRPLSRPGLSRDDWSRRLRFFFFRLFAYAQHLIFPAAVAVDRQAFAAGFVCEEIGLLDVFYREYRNQPVSKETAKFKQEYFKWYEETDEAFAKKRSRLENIVICDPAKTVKPDSADTAIVGVGVDAKLPAVYVRDVVAGKLLPDQLYNEVFAMADRLKARVIGLKVTSLNEFITYPFRTEMVKRGRFYDLVEIKERASKEERVGSLVPFYRLGYIYHNRTCCDALEGQLISYPRSKRWDIMDALADIVEMLEMGERYFSAPEEADKDIEDEYKELEDEFDQDERMPRMAGWRAI